MTDASGASEAPTYALRSRPGDLLRYTSERPNRWCREGLAVADDRGVLVDTYWSVSGDNHVLTDAEIRTGRVLLNLHDYDEVPRADLWEQYAESDRGLVTSQHGLERRYYVRKGSAPDPRTMIENARARVTEAAAKVESAKRDLDWRQRELHALLATAKADEVTP